MKKLTDDTLLARVLAWTADFVIHHRRIVIYSQIILFVVSGVYAWQFLRFDPDRDNLVGKNERYQGAFIAYRKEFPQQDDLAVVVESEDLEKNRQFVERLGARVLAEPALFTNVLFNNDLRMMGPKAWGFMSESDL